MPDNVQANPGAGGAEFATDQIGGTVHWPFTKVAWGPRDTANEVDAAAGKAFPTQGEAAHDAALTGNPFVIAGRSSAAAPSDVSSDNDVVRIWALRNGSPVVTLQAGNQLIGGTTANGLTVDVTRVQGSVTIAGGAAHDAAVSGNPLLMGMEARTSDGTPVTSGDAVRALADTLGKQVMIQGAPHDLHSNGTVNRTDNAAADVIGAAGAGVRIVVTGILVTNAHATVGTKVSIRDGTTARAVGFAAAAGGGFMLENGGRPIFIGTANTAITAICGTTGADVDITVFGYRITN